MKKTALAFGVIIVLAGLMLIPLSNTSTTTTNYNWKEQASPEVSSWSISQNFNGSEILGFDFRPHSDWSDNTFDFYYSNITGTEQPVRYLQIDVTNSQGNYTSIRIMLFITINAGASGVSVLPDYFEVFNRTLSLNITVSPWVRLDPAEGFSDPSGGIVIEKGYPSIFSTKEGYSVYQLGKASVKGVYNVSLSLDPATVFEPDTNKRVASPPVVLDLFATRIETLYPYSWLLPVGVPTSIVGLAITIFGANSKKHGPLKGA